MDGEQEQTAKVLQAQDTAAPAEQQQTAESLADAIFGDVEEKKPEQTEDMVAENIADTTKEPDPLLDELSALTKEKKPETATPGKVNGYELELPDGIAADHPLLEQFTKLAAETKADPKLVQGSVKLIETFQKEFFKEIQSREQHALNELSNTFIRQSQADPVYGGAKYDETTNYALKAIRHFTTDKDFSATIEKDGYMGLREFLVASRGINHPVMRKMLAEMGKQISESPPVIPGAVGPDPAPKTRAEAIFGGISEGV